MDITLEQFMSAEVQDISQVYLGKDRHCRCGCGGKYTATSYMDSPRTDEIDDELVSKRLARAKMLVKEGCHVDFGSNNVNVVTGNNRAMTFYFDELKKAH